MKRILVLGAGLVARPLVHYLTENPEFELTVASRTVAKAEAMVAGRSRGRAIALDVSDEAALSARIAEHDIAISLLPANEHPKVARLCLAHKKHMATTSYFSDEMLALEADVKSAGLTFINECGVDPGTDHMSAMRVIDSVKQAGGKVVSFRSYCGGLPAPEANTNPLGYKFSWAPRGVLVAATNNARFLRDGQNVDVPGDELFAAPESVVIDGVGSFEGYPNRDSFPYRKMYGLDDTLTMFRGTLRHAKHCETWYHWVKLGLFDQQIRPEIGGQTLQSFMLALAGGSGDARRAVADKMGVAISHPAVEKLAWLGMFEDTSLAESPQGNIDVTAAQMLKKCPYEENERDMIVMRHEFDVTYPQGGTESITSTLVDYGIPGGDSSMARTVSLPVAIAVRMILEGQLTQRGVIAPLAPEIYNPILDELARLNIAFKEEKSS